MKTFRSLLKSKLIELGYPIEISKFCANGRVRNLGRDIISKKGIKIKRESYPEYIDGHSGRYYEDIYINTNGYIDTNELEKIVEELKKEYSCKLLSVYINK